MSAEILRRAAAEMRERADAANATEAWDWRSTKGGTYWPEATRSGRYIQSWHPDVAVAVADLLDDAAEALDLNTPTGESALAVARAYLREQS